MSRSTVILVILVLIAAACSGDSSDSEYIRYQGTEYLVPTEESCSKAVRDKIEVGSWVRLERLEDGAVVFQIKNLSSEDRHIRVKDPIFLLRMYEAVPYTQGVIEVSPQIGIAGAVYAFWCEPKNQVHFLGLWVSMYQYCTRFPDLLTAYPKEKVSSFFDVDPCN